VTICWRGSGEFRPGARFEAGAKEQTTMAYERTAAWGAESAGEERLTREEARVRRDFWAKAQKVAAHLPFAEELLAAYYCAFDHATPLHVKATLVGALAYFVMPVDFLPDLLPLLGFTDDAAVLLTVVRMVAGNLRPEHRAAARASLQRIKEGHSREDQG
jgi:uncharacterized membrane protein YkvA (DUF1232 family)